jgi:predicted aspartyl protease
MVASIKVTRAPIFLMVLVLFLLCIKMPESIAAEDSEIPFDYKNGQIVITATVNSGKPLNFLVDTGASGVIVDQRTAYDIGLPMEQAKTVESSAGQVAVKSSHVGRFAIGSLEFNDLPIFIADLSTQSNKYGCVVSGIVGARLLNKYTVSIDYGAQTLGLNQNSPESMSKNTETIPLVQDEPPMIQAKINGQYMQLFVIDTGSSINSIPIDLAVRLRTPGPQDSTSGMGLDGRELRLDTCVIKSIELGSFTKDNVLCHFASVPGTEKFSKGFLLSSTIGTLGNPFWQDYKLTLDYKQHKLFVQPGAAQGARREVVDAITKGDEALNYHRQYREAERFYNAALSKVNFTRDSKYEAIALGRAANLKRVMAKDLTRPEYAKVAYDYFVKALEVARAVGDKDVEAHILADWSLLYSDNGQDSEAWQMIQAALQLSPDEIQVMVDQSILLFRCKSFNDMQGLLKEVLAQDPSNWQALWYQVKLDQQSSNNDSLRYTLKQILQYYPWSKTASDTLASLGSDKDLHHDVHQ